MKAVEAMDLFHGREKFNCAQAVLKAFQVESGISEDTIETAAYHGGGRAPEGVCGALHVARVILTGDPALKGIEKEFAGKAGSKQCLEIRGMRTLPCRGCVALSAYLIEHHLNAEIAHESISNRIFNSKIREMTSGGGNVRCPGCNEI